MARPADIFRCANRGEVRYIECIRLQKVPGAAFCYGTNCVQGEKIREKFGFKSDYELDKLLFVDKEHWG